MKIIMPIAGKGTRLRPHTHVIPKPLIRVAGKPIIDYILDQVAGIDFSEIIFIIGHLGEQIRHFMKENHKFPMKFVKQIDFHGLGHAISHAKSEFPVDEPILILLGDIIFTADIEKIIQSETNMLGLMKVDDPRKFGVVTVDSKGYVMKMVEKPENPPSDLAIAGVYYFKSAFKLFDAIDHLIQGKIKTKNEYQLTDAMTKMMDDGEKFKTFEVTEWFDCGEKESLIETNEVMLKKNLKHEQVWGNIIIPPVFIGKNTTLKHSIIGPNVSISDGAQITETILKNSLIGINTIVENCNLDNSLIGDNAVVSGACHEMNIGPDSEITLI